MTVASGDDVSDNPYSKVATSMFVISWLIVFALMVLFFNRYEAQQESTMLVSQGHHKTLLITANRKGHYKFSGLINAVRVTFLVDTGATAVAVPRGLAKQLGLTEYYPVQLKTANGEATGYLTRLKSLEIGSIKLNNVRAVIMPGSEDDVVLLGMNVLGALEMTQANNTLTIKQK